jgi:hypothetical protein
MGHIYVQPEIGKENYKSFTRHKQISFRTQINAKEAASTKQNALTAH